MERHLTNFRFVFPFGRPEGALKSTISLLERVSKVAVTYVIHWKQDVSSLIGQSACVARYILFLVEHMIGAFKKKLTFQSTDRVNIMNPKYFKT